MDIYFACSIRAGGQDRGLYKELIDHLKTKGTVLSEIFGDPIIDDLDQKCTVEDDFRIHDEDIRMIEKSACLIVEVTLPSLGVGYEVGRSVAMGKPVLCLFREVPCPENGMRPAHNIQLSAMIRGCSQITTATYKTVAEAEAIIDKFIAGMKK